MLQKCYFSFLYHDRIEIILIYCALSLITSGGRCAGWVLASGWCVWFGRCAGVWETGWGWAVGGVGGLVLGWVFVGALFLARCSLSLCWGLYPGGFARAVRGGCCVLAAWWSRLGPGGAAGGGEGLGDRDGEGGLHVSMGGAGVVGSGVGLDVLGGSGGCPCGFCLAGVGGAGAVRCGGCGCWVHGGCGGFGGSLMRVTNVLVLPGLLVEGTPWGLGLGAGGLRLSLGSAALGMCSLRGVAAGWLRSGAAGVRGAGSGGCFPFSPAAGCPFWPGVGCARRVWGVWCCVRRGLGPLGRVRWAVSGVVALPWSVGSAVLGWGMGLARAPFSRGLASGALMWCSAPVGWFGGVERGAGWV